MLSVYYITKNEEYIFEKTLASVKDFADEIIVVDSGSQDNTLEICKKFGAKVFSEDWKGFALQKNSAMGKCSGDWLLALDADEVVSEELKQSIIKAIHSDKIKSYYLDRKTVYLGEPLKYSWRPDKRLRLAHKSLNPVWRGEVVHESLNVQSSETEALAGELLHFSYKNAETHYRKTIDYAKLSALDYFKRGKKFKFYKLILNPIFAFVKLYFIRLGMLDGFRGFSAGVSAFLYAFLKYLFLWEMYKTNKNDK